MTETIEPNDASNASQGLTEAQRGEVINLLHGYWGSDAARTLARDAAEGAVERKLEYGIKAKVAAIAENDATMRTAIDQIFRNSGRLVQSEGSKVFDDIIAAFMRDEAGGIPDAIRQHVRDNLPDLVQRAVTQVAVAMVVESVAAVGSVLASETHQMIRDAFMKARVNPGY